MKLRYLTIVVLAAAVLVGCTQQSSTDDGGTTSDEVRLVWWGTTLPVEVIQPLIDEYESLNTSVQIDYSTSRWNTAVANQEAASQYQEEVNKTLTSNNLLTIPDIFSIDSTWVGMYERFLYPAPAEMISAETFESIFLPATDNLLSADAATGVTNVLGVPLYMDVLGMVYNNDLLVSQTPGQQIPTNWNDFRDVARSITTRSASGDVSKSGFAGGYGSNVDFSADTFNLLMYQNGVSVVDAFGTPNFASSGDAFTALEFYKSFADSNSRTWMPDTEYFSNDSVAFLEGNLMSTLVPSWRYRQILTYNDAYDLGLDVRVAKVPQLSGEEVHWASYHANVVSLQRPNATAAWQFLLWLAQPEQLRKLNENVQSNSSFFGTLYPRSDMQAELANDPYLSTYADMLDQAVTWQMVDGMRASSAFRTLLDKSNVTVEDLAATENELISIVARKNELVN